MFAVAYRQEDKNRQKQSRKRLLSQATILSLISLLLILTASAQASPTTAYNTTNSFCDSSLSEIQTTVKIFESANTGLVKIGSQITNPYVAFANSINSQKNYAKSLPAVPTALLMTLIGFICVSLVRDRRLWLAAFSGILWVSHTGFRAVPQLASHVCRTAHTIQQLTSTHNLCYSLENNARARCDIEGTGYIGLLSYLDGIPKTRNVLQPHQSAPSNASVKNQNKFQPYQFAIIRQLPFLISTTNCQALQTVQSFRLLSKFMIHNLSRAPPFLNWTNFCVVKIKLH